MLKSEEDIRSLYRSYIELYACSEFNKKEDGTFERTCKFDVITKVRQYILIYIRFNINICLFYILWYDFFVENSSEIRDGYHSSLP